MTTICLNAVILSGGEAGVEESLWEKEIHQLSWWTKRLKLWTKRDPLRKMTIGLPTESGYEGGESMKDNNSLAHTRWNCKYHVVFAPKYRRQAIYGELRAEIGQILRKLCEQKGIEIIEANACPDHIHMLISIPPKISVSGFMGILKGKSSVLIYEKFGDMKYKYRNREFWCRGYYVDTVGKNTKAIAEYIKHQLEEDKLGEQMTMLGKANNNPFTGSK